MPTTTSTILDQISAEKTKISERLARLDADREKIAIQLTDLETAERVLTRVGKTPPGRRLRSAPAAEAKAAIAPPKRSHLRKVAEDFVQMARAYYEDAKHFREQGELEKALANVNYAHGWLDAGARLGLFDVGGDAQLFTLSE